MRLVSDLLGKFYLEEIMELCTHYDVPLAAKDIEPTLDMLVSCQTPQKGFGIIDVSKTKK